MTMSDNQDADQYIPLNAVDMFNLHTANQAFLDAELQGVECGFRSNPVVDAICLKVDEFLRTRPRLPYRVIRGNYVQLAHYILRILNIDVKAHYESHFLGSLVDRIYILSQDCFDELPQVIEYRDRARQERITTKSNNDSELIARAKEALKLSSLQQIRALKGGLSGSTVLMVFYRSADDARLRFGVLKSSSDEDEINREMAGHSAAVKSWLSAWVNAEMQQAQLEAPRSQLLLMPLAVVPADPKYIVDSLYEAAAARNKAITNEVAICVGRAYSDKYHSTKEDVVTLSVAAKSVIAGRRHFLEKLQDPDFWLTACLPSPATQCVTTRNGVTWNPVWLIKHLCDDVATQGTWRKAPQHGDLNARNIIPDLAQPHQIRLIDFEKWTESTALLDPCWLACQLIRGLSGVNISTVPWEIAAEEFAVAILDPDAPNRYDCAALQYGIDNARTLFREVHAQTVNAEERAKLKNELQLTLGVAASIIAYYCIRPLEAFDEDLKAEDIAERRIWGVFFWHVAAHALQKYGDDHHPPPGDSLMNCVDRVLGRSPGR